ncbi:MAG TPA: M28 family peptidase [Terriglobales bacterium]|nr:M28 family peptidase [Terriglobales bacterium]
MNLFKGGGILGALMLSATLGCSEPRPGATTGGAKNAEPSFAEQQAKMEAKASVSSAPAPRIDEKRTMEYVKEIVAFGRRAPGSPGQKKQQEYIRAKFQGDTLEEDVFTAETPAGKFEIRNLIVKYPGTEDSVILLGSHYDTNYPLKNYVGANDGGSSTALLLEIANHLRARKLKGPSVWLVFFDGEEAFDHWTATDSLYGSRHLAAKWKQDGTLKKIKAFILADMIGDADLNIQQETYSTSWLREMVMQAASNLGHKSHFLGPEGGIEDDHIPFRKEGVPVVDIIDLDYGYGNVFHHSPNDTLDKVSPKSLKIVGDVIFETLRLLGSS